MSIMKLKLILIILICIIIGDLNCNRTKTSSQQRIKTIDEIKEIVKTQYNPLGDIEDIFFQKEEENGKDKLICYVQVHLPGKVSDKQGIMEREYWVLIHIDAITGEIIAVRAVHRK